MSPLVRRLSTVQVVLDVLLGVIALGIGVLGAATSGTGLAAVVGAVALAVGVAVRRISPWAMVGLALTGGLLELLTASVNVGAVLVLMLLFSTTGNDPSRPVRWTGLVAGAAASAGAGIAAGTHGFFGDAVPTTLHSGLVVAAQTAVVAGSAWLVGFVRHQRRVTGEARIAERLARLQLEHEQERTRIARDMHDVVAHTLAVVVAQAEGTRYAMTRRPELAEHSLRTIADLCRGSLGDVRRLLGELRGEPALPSDSPGDEALFDRMREAGLDLLVEDVGVPRPLPSAQADAARWALTEALTNALKHGVPGSPVTVRRSWEHDLELTVANAVGDAVGNAVGSDRVGSGHGLTGIAERARLAGGSCQHRVDGDRFLLTVRLPCEEAAT